ncbi:hypothetical protein DID88_000922 [Monilinia fructigena]|uniref:Uncharacterized protein n=1 Tax=Monilinia fructigena TaxID=38457 RepID=A0A395IZS9_9HELO|nr:hypothetical protein DID88_000922 [Monilinia fructigena]
MKSKALGEVVSGSKAGQERAVATAREMDVLKTEIAGLQAAVRYLREDNRRVKTFWAGEYVLVRRTVDQT